jgi:hypothetical protein
MYKPKKNGYTQSLCTYGKMRRYCYDDVANALEHMPLPHK